jgi:hypothetical protein
VACLWKLGLALVASCISSGDGSIPIWRCSCRYPSGRLISSSCFPFILTWTFGLLLPTDSFRQTLPPCLFIPHPSSLSLLSVSLTPHLIFKIPPQHRIYPYTHRRHCRPEGSVEHSDLSLLQDSSSTFVLISQYSRNRPLLSLSSVLYI